MRRKALPARQSSRRVQRWPGGGRDIPNTFVAQLYGRSVPEDVVRYGADDIATLAEHAYDFIAERAPGAPKIRCETLPLAASGDRKSISVIEIVNDDMPFLVDSVMGEIADRRLDVRLVAHPMFGVRRNGNKLIALGSPDTAEGKRESFIHIHLVPIADERVRHELDPCAGDRARRGAAGSAGLAPNARPRQRHCGRSEGQSAAIAGR